MRIKRFLESIKQGCTPTDQFKLASFFVLNKILNIRGWDIKVNISNEDGTFYCRSLDHVYMYSVYREPELREYFKMSKNGVFLDVGANIGKYSFLVAKKYPESRIVAIEPEEESLKIFKKNIKLNNLKNISIVNKIVADSKRGINFFVNFDKPTRSTIEKGEIQGQAKYQKSNDKKYSSFKIRKLNAITIDEISKNYKCINLIKIDIQEAEILALKGAKETLKSYKPDIIFESLNNRKYEEIKEFLHPFGYKFHRINQFNYLASVKK